MLQSPRGGTAAGYATLVSWDRTGHAHHCEVARSQTTTATQASCVKLKRKHAFTQIYIYRYRYIYIYTHDSSPGQRPAIPNTGHTRISLDQKESLVAPWHLTALLPFTALSAPHFSFSIHQAK
jgi:hypothetical protein